MHKHEAHMLTQPAVRRMWNKGRPSIGNKANGGPSANKGLLDAVNKVRREHGLNELVELRQLDDAARKNDEANKATGHLDHHNGLINGADGEITGMASGGMTPEMAIQMWLNSPGHRAILLDPNQTYVGVSIMGNYATVDFR